jgi:PAS domain-containing protein
MKNYEKEIKQEKKSATTIARYETLFAVTSVGIGITDETGRLIECNESVQRDAGIWPGRALRQEDSGF